MPAASALIVDLRPTARAFGDAVARLGLIPAYAEGAGEALQRFEELTPAVVLLGVEPSDLPGLQLLNRLSGSRHIPVIAVVESGSLRVAIEAMRRGAIDVLDKHATIRDVEEAIESVLTQRFEKSIARVLTAARLHHRLVDQTQQRIENVDLRDAIIAHDDLGRSFIEICRKHRQTPEDRTLSCIEQIV